MGPEKMQQRQTFQEIMEILPLPPGKEGNQNDQPRFMSCRSAWLPGCDLAFLQGNGNVLGHGKPLPRTHTAVYGGHVYSQSALAACLVRKDHESRDRDSKSQALHTIHGTFTLAGHADRPFIYTVSPLSTTKSFSTTLVTAAQPSAPSTNPDGDNFPIDDSTLPMGQSCFQALVSFKTAESTQRHEQEPSVQSRFKNILESRIPMDWPPAPPLDISGILDAIPMVSRMVGTFPALEMRKVDMTTYNKDKPLYERRELILYRLLAPLPKDASPSEHALVHVYECDRNGLLMLANHLGYGDRLGGVASLTWTYVIHGNIDESRIEFGEDEWWVQEACWPRAGSGRGIIMSKIWSPEGDHVATEYQDGVSRRWSKDGKL
ncbi:hypothetical protein MKZ38_003705 [Zalerion maritima]|uniref:Uncharacterized protein n=1 Tax=Zalerion maritima TaxID=339359 RepID=A0AAD5WWJ6_9PEZI|nr:hypothetical protein MKZ38_003705 [Zalerion maritima]